MKAVELCAGRITPEGPSCPLFSSYVYAGFPSPADDYLESWLDLNEHVIQHPETTYFVRTAGDSMIGAGIHEGDILVVDRAPEAKNGDIVIAALDGELTVKRLRSIDGKHFLMPENSQYQPIAIREDAEVLVWGVVTYVIHKV